MKQIFIAAVFLATAASAAPAAQTSRDKRAAAPPATTPSRGDSNSPALHTLERSDAVKISEPAAGLTRPPEPTDSVGDRKGDDLTPDPTPTPPDESPAKTIEETGPAPASGTGDGGESPAGPADVPVAAARFRWRAAVEQSMLFLAIQHGYALTQPKTRHALHGSFFKDYARSVRSLHGWGDGGKFFTNYVAHPMQGSLMGFVQVQNDPAGSRLRLGMSGAYWRSRMKALAWSAAWSTQFEVGPLSQASLGNVGLHGKQTYVDLVMTPTAGLGLLLAEDALDRYVIERLERRNGSAFVRILARMTLNPTRTAANLLRFKKPWHRDAGLR